MPQEDNQMTLSASGALAPLETLLATLVTEEFVVVNVFQVGPTATPWGLPGEWKVHIRALYSTQSGMGTGPSLREALAAAYNVAKRSERFVSQANEQARRQARGEAPPRAAWSLGRIGLSDPGAPLTDEDLF